jgi:hypothetical protein
VPYPFVFVNEDGSVRELHSAERRYLETPFEASDGARPYIKTSFDQRDGWGRLSGFCYRSLVPSDRPIAPAPPDDPDPPMTSEEYIRRMRRLLGNDPDSAP